MVRSAQVRLLPTAVTTVKGIVLTPTGRPDGSATVHLIGEPAVAGYARPDERVAKVAIKTIGSSGNGSFTMEGVAAGDYTLLAVHSLDKQPFELAEIPVHVAFRFVISKSA